MNIIVCPLSRVEQMVAAHTPELVVSLLDPEFDFPELGPTYRTRHLRLHIHDVHAGGPGQVVPTPKHVGRLLEFLGRWQRSSPLLIHCRAGIGRSPAAAFIAACVHSPNISERTIALELRRASSLARPNQVLVELADVAMGRNRRMAGAIEETGRNLQPNRVDENVPFEIPDIFPSEPR